MKKRSLVLLLLLAAMLTASAQRKKIDTLRLALSKANGQDTVRLNILKELSRDYFISKPDSSLAYGQEAYDLAVKFKLLKGQSQALNYMADAYASLGDYAKCLPLYFKIIRLDESIDYQPGVATAYNNIGSVYVQKQDYLKALPYLRTGLNKWDLYLATHKVKRYNERELRSVLLLNIAEVFLYTHKIDSANHYLQICYADSKKKHYQDLLNGIERDLGEVENARGHKEAALKYFKDAIAISIAEEDVDNLSIAYLSAANLYHRDKQQDSAEYYAQKALETASAGKYLQDVLNAGKVLYAYYDEDHNLPQAYKYLKITTAAKDSIFSQDQVKQLLSMDFDEKQRQRDIETAQAQERDAIRMYILIAGMVVLLLLAFIFWRASKQRAKANQQLSKQKGEVESALTQLQSAQTQLIQSEKMASLGELTAGIAHEIQNPLNFVNNFSEVNKEMLEDLENEIKSGNKEDALALTKDIIKNEEKINHHGKRADFIVKGMLQHSRTNTGEKQPTNINVLADEFFKLSYHGSRAKDKSFNAEMATHFDPNLPKVNVVQQEIGRVLLNLFNNAFYAVNQKKKTAGVDYKPEVSLITSSENGHVIIKVKDNGTGIPDSIKEKIMQPFFTTKPTGEGTGLGLSLTYDMVVKGHGGSINIDTKEGEYSEFIVRLPLS